ncbi:DUF3231 family protein [Clostridium sp.]|jgi:hypothetical protein|uniref:DUF3231 family protein n=1 Tax=Clostridium sp. TaxID=1506 RepID=UPI003EF07228
MTTEAKIQLTSSELSTLWMLYTSQTERLTLFDLFRNKTIDKEAQNILNSYITDTTNIKNKIINLFNNENIVIPLGINEKDIVSEVPPLFDDIFNIMHLRRGMKLASGRTGVFSVMSYMKEVNDIFKLDFEIANKYYMMTTNYLLVKGVLTKSPHAPMPKQVEFIEDKNYMSGYNLLSDKRSLDTIEVSYISETIENNILDMKLLTGFAQVATEIEVKKYFIEGKELLKKHIAELSNLLLQSDIEPPNTLAGIVTDSTQTPFSDKLMMYINGLLSSTPLGFTGLDTPFSMRNDLPLKLGLISKDIFEYSKKGGKIMIEHKWMEQPPQM